MTEGGWAGDWVSILTKLGSFRFSINPCVPEGSLAFSWTCQCHASAICEFLGKRSVGRWLIGGDGSQVTLDSAGQGGPCSQGRHLQVEVHLAQVHRVKVAALGKGERPMLPKVIKCMQALLLQARVS